MIRMVYYLKFCGDFLNGKVTPKTVYIVCFLKIIVIIAIAQRRDLKFHFLVFLAVRRFVSRKFR